MGKIGAFASVIALLMSTTAFAGSADKRIALSNNYAGNSWRQAMLQSWDKVTKKAVADKLVAAADPFTTADKEAPNSGRPDPEPDSTGIQRHCARRRLA